MEQRLWMAGYGASVAFLGQSFMVAVGMRVAPHPPHRSRRALLTHRAPASGSDVPA
jgi:hypothetical protein